MKITKLDGMKRALMGGLIALVSATAGTGCSEFNPMFGPTRISSTYKQRGMFKLGEQMDKFMKSGVEYKVDEKDHTLYVRADNFHETMSQFGLKNTSTFGETFETNRITIEYTNPKTGQVYSSTQMIANDGTIDTPFGSVNVFGTRTAADERVTKKAREYFNDPTMEVELRQVAGEFVDPFIFLGFADATTNSTPAVPINKATMVSDLQGVIFASSMADTKYIAVSKRSTNLDKKNEAGIFYDSNGDGKLVTDRNDPNYIRRVVLVAETGKAAFHGYDKIDIGHEDIILGIGNSDFGLGYRIRDFGRIGEFFNSVTGASEGVQDAHYSIETLARKNYLPQNQGKKETPLQKAGRLTGEIADVTGNLSGIKGDVKALTPEPSTGNAPGE